MGEGGENNKLWYIGTYKLLEQYNISWCFWAYKKMDSLNSPTTFPMPRKWYQILEYIGEDKILDGCTAQDIFSEFLYMLGEKCEVQHEVFRAIKREAPITIPAEHFSTYVSNTDRVWGSNCRISCPISIMYMNPNRTEGVNYYSNYDKWDGVENDRFYVQLNEGEEVTYVFEVDEARPYAIILICEALVEGAYLRMRLDDHQIYRGYINMEWNKLVLYSKFMETGTHTCKLIVSEKVINIKELSIK